MQADYSVGARARQRAGHRGMGHDRASHISWLRLPGKLCCWSVDRARALHVATLAASFYNVGAVVLAQLSWSLWPHVGRSEFPRYHRAWFKGMMPSIWPMASVAGVGAIAQIVVRPAGVPAWAGWIGALLQLANFGLTGAWWARWQAQLHDVRLEDGSLNPLYLKLIRTHWLRVGLIIAFALLQAWMLAADAGESGEARLPDRSGWRQRRRVLGS